MLDPQFLSELGQGGEAARAGTTPESRSTAGGDAPGSQGVPGGAAAPPPGEPARARRQYEPKPRKLPHVSIHQLTCTTDELGRRFFRMADGRAVCGRRLLAKNRVIEDEACLAIPTVHGPCRAHGAGGGRPLTSGRYSRVLRHWGRSFRRALDDKELLDSRREVAMADTLIEGLVARAELGDSPSWRAEVTRLFDELDEAVKAMNHAAVGPLLRQLGELIHKGASEDQVRTDLLGELERRTRCAVKVNELELRREEKVTATEVAALLGTWVLILERTVDPETLRKLVPMLRAALPESPDLPRSLPAARRELVREAQWAETS